LLNIGNNNPVKLLDYISAIESELGIEAIKEFLPIQPGDVPDTFADVSQLEEVVGYKPTTSVKEGVKAFVEWYRAYYKI
jgi:UDP-glucuronate 4-epimerase